MRFSELLTKYREKRGLSKVDLAQKINLSPGYIGNIENGHRPPPSLEHCNKISYILKLNEEEKELFLNAAVKEVVIEKNQEWFNEVTPNQIAMSSPKGISIKEVKIPVVSMAKGGEMDGVLFEELEPHDYTYIDFSGCKAVRISGNSMAPLAYNNQLVIYSEEEEVRDGDLVFISLKKNGQYFKRYHKDAKNGIVTLLSINIANHGPINTKVSDIEFMYKVVGVKF